MVTVASCLAISFTVRAGVALIGAGMGETVILLAPMRRCTAQKPMGEIGLCWLRDGIWYSHHAIFGLLNRDGAAKAGSATILKCDRLTAGVA